LIKASAEEKNARVEMKRSLNSNEKSDQRAINALVMVLFY
jgi:hypothetical protein